MREAVKAFGLTPIEEEGYEADDLIATYACQAREAGADVLIISSDKDLMQLVADKVLFYDFESGAKGRPGYRPERKIDRQGVIDYFGVPPEKVIDVQALVGDTSDNVPGVPGIGVKTAAQLITNTATSKRCWPAPPRSSSRSGASCSPASPTRRGCRRGWSRSTATSRSRCRSPRSASRNPTARA